MPKNITLRFSEDDSAVSSVSDSPPPTPPPAPPPAPEKGPERLTISDDRSTGSNLEVRNLVALKDRTASDKSSEPSRALTPGYVPVEPGRPRARKNSAPQPPAKIRNYAIPEIPPSAAKRPVGYAQMQQRFGQLQFDKAMAIGADSSEMNDPNMNAAMDDMPETNILKGQGNGHLAAEANHSWVGVSATTSSDHLDAQDMHQTGIESLQQQITMLQDELRQLGNQKQKESPKLYHVLYRIDKKSYFDHPEWTQGNRAIVSRVPVQNLDLFLERNKSVLFIVYRDFNVIQMPKKGSTLQRPTHSEESIHPVNKRLRGAIEILLQNNWRYESFLQGFYKTGEVKAPYLFIYHNRPYWADILVEFSRHVREHLTVVARYVSQNYGHEYAAADALFARRKVSVNFVKYLFQPGDILVSRTDGQYRGLVAKSWPDVTEKAGETSEIETSDTDDNDEWDYFAPDSQTHAPSKKSEVMPNSFRGSDKAVLFAQDKKNGLVRKSGSADISSKVFRIQMWKWSFDGDFKRQRDDVVLRVSQKTTNISIEATEWNMHDLDIYPLRLASRSVVNLLRRRGRMFWRCRKRCLISYQEWGTEAQDESDERFMIDFHTFRKLHPENKSHTIENPAETMSQDEMDQEEPPDEAFLYLVPLQTKGFNLRTKKWLDLNMDQIHSVVWNKKAFDTLVLDRKTKELITALVSKQISSTKSTDVIAGKGNGLILLLHGGPGTGKTLTAEGVAEIAKKPLYRVTCGDVGTKAEDVEKYLESVLHLGKIWDCVVLLDEAEVFLERRSLDDLQRNALVSVFLRVIEYHEGILILTSNRVGTFDEAFRSRIQIAVHYPPLRAYQRLQIWKNFIDRLESFNDGAVDVDGLRDHLEELQDIEINGRQIRNAITTARQYAEWKDQVMNYEHLMTALEVARKFDAYSEKLRGGLTDDQIAEEEGIR